MWRGHHPRETHSSVDSILYAAVATPLRGPAILSQRMFFYYQVPWPVKLKSGAGVNIQLFLSKAHWVLKGTKCFRLEELYLPVSGPVEESP